MDEAYAVAAISCGVGACSSTGSRASISGATQNSCVAKTAQTTVDDATIPGNNIDDDRDGMVDEGGGGGESGNDTANAGDGGGGGTIITLGRQRAQQALVSYVFCIACTARTRRESRPDLGRVGSMFYELCARDLADPR